MDARREEEGSLGENLELAALPMQQTDFVCADCGDAITYMDEVFLLQVVRPQLYQGRTVHHQVIDEHDVQGSFRFGPYYFCFRCWEKNYEDVCEDISDEPPVEDSASLFECVCCASGIREFELAGTFTLGEFQISERSPSGTASHSFIPMSNVDMICLYCLTILNEGYIDMWGDLSEDRECPDCVQGRCWRCTHCECRCHRAPPDDDCEEELQMFPAFR
jgi:hypothetical protein